MKCAGDVKASRIASLSSSHREPLRKRRAALRARSHWGSSISCGGAASLTTSSFGIGARLLVSQLRHHRALQDVRVSSARMLVRRCRGAGRIVDRDNYSVGSRYIGYRLFQKFLNRAGCFGESAMATGTMLARAIVRKTIVGIFISGAPSDQMFFLYAQASSCSAGILPVPPISTRRSMLKTLSSQTAR